MEPQVPVRDRGSCPFSEVLVVFGLICGDECKRMGGLLESRLGSNKECVPIVVLRRRWGALLGWIVFLNCWW